MRTHTQVAELPKKSGRFIVNDTPDFNQIINLSAITAAYAY